MLFERAVEALDEAISSAPPHIRAMMEASLDRPILRNPDSGMIDCGLDPQSMPRARGSRSRYAAAVLPLRSMHDMLRDTKERYLREELDALLGVQPTHDPTLTLDAVRTLTALVRR